MKERLLPRTAQGEVNTGSLPKPRRKGPRRRIVELTRSDSPPVTQIDSMGDLIKTVNHTGSRSDAYTVIAGDSSPQPQRAHSQRQRPSPSQFPPGPPPRIDTTINTPSIQTSYATPTIQALSKESQDWSISGE